MTEVICCDIIKLYLFYTAIIIQEKYNPCDLFERIDFPVDEFFPPEKCAFLERGEDDPSEPPAKKCDCR